MSVADCNLFANSLYSHGVRAWDGAKSFVISPLSIQTALGLAYMGAEGKTAEEMKNGLRLMGGDKANVEKYFETTLSLAYANKVLMANKMFVQKEFPIHESFAEKAAKSFLSEVENINFADKEAAVTAINGWIEEKTNNKIKNFLDQSAITADTRLMLVNTIYVEAFWASPFSKDQTRPADFYTSDRHKIQLDTMHSTKHLLSCDLRGLDASAVKLGCKESDISLLIVLPNKRTGLAELESKIDSSELDINEIVNEMKHGMVVLSIPKFKFEAVVNMENILRSMGMSTMFSPNANFKGISDVNLMVTSVLHKAVIEVNEVGLIASAATVIKMGLGCARSQRHFNADHPFWFAIRQGDTVLFTGRFTGQ